MPVTGKHTRSLVFPNSMSCKNLDNITTYSYLKAYEAQIGIIA